MWARLDPVSVKNLQLFPNGHESTKMKEQPPARLVVVYCVQGQLLPFFTDCAILIPKSFCEGENRMLRCAIVEDSPRELEHLKECLARYSAERDIPLETTAFGDAASFLEHYRADYDIVFMDIELPGINGMEAAHRLREIDRQVILIFVTNMAQFAVKGYEVDALDYIIKPAQYGPLSIKLDRAAQRWRAAAESVMVALPTGTQRLLLWEIYYIEVQGHKLTYHTEKGQLPGTGTLQDAEQRLHGKGFLRCNKCYLVNQKHIQTVTGSDVVLSNGEKLQISRLRKKEFMEELARSMGNEFVL